MVEYYFCYCQYKVFLSLYCLYYDELSHNCLLLLGVTMDTRSTVASSNQLVSSSGVGELLRSCDL